MADATRLPRDQWRIEPAPDGESVLLSAWGRDGWRLWVKVPPPAEPSALPPGGQPSGDG